MMDLTSLIERSSSFTVKLGMPLVYAYHLICGNPFLNVAAEDAQGIERAANCALIPFQYLFEGKRAIPRTSAQEGQYNYVFERRFDYQEHFFLKTAASITALPFSLIIGGSLKSLSMLTRESQQHLNAIVHSLSAIKVTSHLDEYSSLGINIGNFETAPLIEKPKYKRRETEVENLKEDIEALRDVAHILKKHQIPFWLDCGSCLGAYRYGGVIPWDWDIDLAVLENDFDNVKQALNELDPEKYVVQDWSGRDLPKTYLKVYVKGNGGLIDIYHFRIDPEKKQVAVILSNEFNIFLPESWKIREKKYTVPMPFDRVFPLKKALFEGMEVPVPAKIEEYLQTYYGENLAPIKIYNQETEQYEKDLSHPYWQQPYAH